MKSQLFLFIFLAIILQSCAGLQFALMLTGEILEDISPPDYNYTEAKSNAYEQRNPKWGLKLQIGDYVIDSIFPSPLIESNIVSIKFDKIAERVPNIKKADYVGKIYNWDAQCARSVSFLPQKDTNSKGLSVPVDVNGYFNFSDVFKKYPIFEEYPGSGSFYIKPNFVDNNTKKIECYNNYGDILVNFSL